MWPVHFLCNHCAQKCVSQIHNQTLHNRHTSNTHETTGCEYPRDPINLKHVGVVLTCLCLLSHFHRRAEPAKCRKTILATSPASARDIGSRCIILIIARGTLCRSHPAQEAQGQALFCTTDILGLGRNISGRTRHDGAVIEWLDNIYDLRIGGLLVDCLRPSSRLELTIQ